MSPSIATKPSRSRILLSILIGLLGAAALAVIAVLVFSPHEMVHLPLLAELPRAELLWGGLELAMDGAPAERFWLAGGFAESTPSQEAHDGLCRDVGSQFRIRFTRWQLDNIVLRFRMAPLADTREIALLLNGKPGQTVYLEPGYHDVAFPLPNDSLFISENVVEFSLKGGEKPGAVIDTIRLEVGGEAVGNGLSVEKRLVGEKTLPVLGTTGSAEANFYVMVPPGARLLLGLGHDRSDLSVSPGRLRIVGRNDAGAEKLLWEGDFPQSGIKNLNLDMGDLAGSLALISFYIKPNPETEDWLYIGEPRLEYSKRDQKNIAGNPIPPTIANKHPRTIVLICLDALRRDFLPIYGNKIINTPYLDAIAKTVLVFDSAYAPSSWTKHVFASIYTAQPGGIHGATKHEAMLRDNVPSLVELFRQNHWRTAVITANPYTSEKFGLNRGFADMFDLSRAEESPARVEDKVYAERFIPILNQWLSSLAPGEDAFIMLHLMDTHTPYLPPPAWRDLYRDQAAALFAGLTTEERYLSPALREQVLRQISYYCGSITYFDSQLPAILDEFRKAGRAEGTTYVFFSDHGEEFLDHGGIKHGFTLYQEMVHVPLLMWGEGVVAGRLSEAVNLEDILPTLLDLAGIKVPVDLEGMSFAGLLGAKDAGWERRQFAETEQNVPSYISLIWHGYKLIVEGNQFELPDGQNAATAGMRPIRSDFYQLYEHATDPQERSNLAAANPIQVGFLKGYLKEWWAKSHSGKLGEVKMANLDAKTLEILKGLGYVQ